MLLFITLLEMKPELKKKKKVYGLFICLSLSIHPSIHQPTSSFPSLPSNLPTYLESSLELRVLYHKMVAADL